MSNTFTVNAEALRLVLNAITGRPHEVREMQVIMRSPVCPANYPIKVIIEEVTEQMKTQLEE